MIASTKVLIKKQPLLAKGLPCAWGFAFGDVLTQYFHRDAGCEQWYSPEKTLMMAAVGGCIAAPVALAQWRMMDALWPCAGVLAQGTKFTLEQVGGWTGRAKVMSLGLIMWKV